MSKASTSQSKTAQKQFEVENKIKDVGNDEYYTYNQPQQEAILESKPWKNDPHYFKNVKMSALALLKIVMHATKGGTIEIMGLMQGKIEGDTFIVLDSFALPVEGTETRVNAGAEAIEYMAQYMGLSERVGRKENVCGWYHSHPGYGCWLSGIDVNTQLNNQKFQDPFIAVVIDPLRTVSSGKVELQSFRTYPEGYKPPQSSSNEYQSIPMDKIEDFGVYHDQYYQMNTEYFKSTMDTNLLNLLWNKYWINILSSSPLIKNRFYTNQQIADLAKKMEKAESDISRGSKFSVQQSLLEGTGGAKKEKKEESQLEIINKDAIKLSVEVLQGCLSQVTKDALFNFGN